MTIIGIIYRDDDKMPLNLAVPHFAGLFRAKTGRHAQEIAVSAKQYSGEAVPDVIGGFPVVLDDYVFMWHYWAREKRE